ncbi:hypothetical protein [Streptomyces sp. NPDC004726]
MSYATDADVRLAAFALGVLWTVRNGRRRTPPNRDGGRGGPRGAAGGRVGAQDTVHGRPEQTLVGGGRHTVHFPRRGPGAVGGENAGDGHTRFRQSRGECSTPCGAGRSQGSGPRPASAASVVCPAELEELEYHRVNAEYRARQERGETGPGIPHDETRPRILDLLPRTLEQPATLRTVLAETDAAWALWHQCAKRFRRQEKTGTRDSFLDPPTCRERLDAAAEPWHRPPPGEDERAAERTRHLRQIALIDRHARADDAVGTRFRAFMDHQLQLAGLR